jgi:phage baseplate assembly protein W
MMAGITFGLYRGYSSFEYEKNKTFSLTDVELVKMDILNHIFTRRGERVMMPTYGTRIPDLAFEPLDEITLGILREDLETVINFDPRVELLQMSVIPDYDSNRVVAAARMLYIELNIIDNLNLNILFEGASE